MIRGKLVGGNMHKIESLSCDASVYFIYGREFTNETMSLTYKLRFKRVLFFTFNPLAIPLDLVI